MPNPYETVFNLVSKIEEVCKLYENTENISVIPQLNNFKEALIYADEKQVARAYLGIRGYGSLIGVTTKNVEKNAVPVIGYYDIFKNYYANTQEKQHNKYS